MSGGSRMEDLNEVSLVAELTGHQDRVWGLVWAPQTDNLVSCSGDKTVKKWTKDLTNPEWVNTHSLEGGHKRTIRSVAISPSGKEIASAGFDSLTAIWEEEFNNQYGCIATLEGHENEVKSVAWSSSGSLLATCSRDKSVWIWEVSPDGDFECLSVLQEHTQDVKMVVWHPTHDLLASASYDDTIKIWREDEDDWACVATLEGHESTVWAIDFNQTGSHLVSVSDDKTIRIWHRSLVGSSQERWDCVQVLQGLFERSLYTVSWDKSSRFGAIAVGGGDNRIVILDHNQSEDADELPKYETHGEIVSPHGSCDINCLRFNPNRPNQFASGGDDSIIRVWQYSS